MREVEADREMRDQMNLYKSEFLMRSEIDNKCNNIIINDDHDSNNNIGMDNDNDDQELKLEELLDGLVMDHEADLEDAIAKNLEEFSLEEGVKAAKDGIHYVGREASRALKDKEGAIPLSSFETKY